MGLIRRFKTASLQCLLLPALLIGLSSCDNDDNGGDTPETNSSGTRGTASVEPIEANIKTSIPLGYAASAAMAAVAGESVPNASASNTCSSYPCLATVSITLAPDELPVGLDEYGEIFIAGMWTAAGRAVLTTSFNDIQIGSGNNVVLKISTFPVTVDIEGITTAVYASIDINVSSEPDDTVMLSEAEAEQELERMSTPVSDDPEVNANMDAWVIRVDSQDTDSLADDSYSVSGGGQYIGVSSTRTSVIQLGLADMQVSSDCALNPVGGLAVLNELDVATMNGDLSEYPKLGVATFRFQPDCNGTARIVAAIGSYGIYVDDAIQLNL